MYYDLFVDFYVNSGDRKPRYTCYLGEIHTIRFDELEEKGFKATLSDHSGFADYALDNATQDQVDAFLREGYQSEVMDVWFSGVDFERIKILALEVEVIDDEGHYPHRGILIGNTFAEFKQTEPLSQVTFTEDFYDYGKSKKRYFSIPYKKLKDYYEVMTQSEVIERLREEFVEDSKREWTFEELREHFESGIDDAVDLACRTFFGLKDMDGNPAILHALAVGMAGKTKNEMITGFLHDVLEDSDLTIYDFDKFGYNYAVVRAMELLTHDKNHDTYEEYITGIIHSGNELARAVKINDLRHNIARTKASGSTYKLALHEQSLERLLAAESEEKNVNL